MASDDLLVQPLSDCLNGFSIDLIVSGSIGAVESVRLIRALRRLGAEVQPWLTQGGAQFTTATALSWAAARPCLLHFEGSASHIAGRDACVIAPASASMIGKLAHGITDSPATALLASYMGQKKPVLLIANMHDSLMQSPFVAVNLQSLRAHCQILDARVEEGKQKFPEPAALADEIAHQLNRTAASAPVLLTMGTTRGYIDSIRYISNYSSGALGTQICHEFYRQGFPVHVVAGPCPKRPRSYTELVSIDTNAEMAAAVQRVAGQSIGSAIFAASVLDFVPSQQREGKIRSAENLEVSFVKTPKIIELLPRRLPMKVAFKLETQFDARSQDIASDYFRRYQLTHLLMNIKSDIDDQRHRALAFTDPALPAHELASKEAIARYLVREAKRLSPGIGSLGLNS